jgi:hypothetical protein
MDGYEFVGNEALRRGLPLSPRVASKGYCLEGHVFVVGIC